MDIIFEPSVIISIVTSLLLAMLSKRLANLGECTIAYLTSFSLKIKNKINIFKWRKKRALLLSIRNEHKVTQAVIRTYTFFILFSLVFISYMFLLTIGPLKDIGNLHSSIILFISSPIYIFEVLWLIQREKTRTLVKIADEKIKNRSFHQRAKYVKRNIVKSVKMKNKTL